MSGHLLGNSHSLGKLYIFIVPVNICYSVSFPLGILGGTLVLIAPAPGDRSLLTFTLISIDFANMAKRMLFMVVFYYLFFTLVCFL